MSEAMNHLDSDYILTLSCPDQKGIVHTVSGVLLNAGGNIIESSQFGDPDTQLFFQRTHFSLQTNQRLDDLRSDLGVEAMRLKMNWSLRPANRKLRVMVAVSKLGHCLNDLLYRWRTGQLPIEICLVCSNHQDLEGLANSFDVPFHYLPVSESNRSAQEEALLHLFRSQDIDLLILARYMQILSPSLCAELHGKAINIHHSFLPSFKGAQPYRQAHQKGVKLIGATAHYVTNQLDEGPIIEQDVERVSHHVSSREMATIGAEIESRVLSRAVRWHAEDRLFMNGSKTVVFS
jgi:formyltetrahydrofolate deformylase